MKIKSHDFGVRVKYSPVSGLWMKYLMASQPCLSTGLKAVAPKISGFLSAMMVSTSLTAFDHTHALNFTNFLFSSSVVQKRVEYGPNLATSNRNERLPPTGHRGVLVKEESRGYVVAQQSARLPLYADVLHVVHDDDTGSHGQGECSNRFLTAL